MGVVNVGTVSYWRGEDSGPLLSIPPYLELIRWKWLQEVNIETQLCFMGSIVLLKLLASFIELVGVS